MAWESRDSLIVAFGVLALLAGIYGMWKSDWLRGRTIHSNQPRTAREHAAYMTWGEMFSFKPMDFLAVQRRAEEKPSTKKASTPEVPVSESAAMDREAAGRHIGEIDSIPPIPAYSPNRRQPVEIGMAAPPAAVLAKRSQENLRRTASPRPIFGPRTSSLNATGTPSTSSTPSTPQTDLMPKDTPLGATSRNRTRSDPNSPSPLRVQVRPESVVDPIPPIPALYATPDNGKHNEDKGNISRRRVTDWKYHLDEPIIGTSPKIGDEEYNRIAEKSRQATRTLKSLPTTPKRSPDTPRQYIIKASPSTLCLFASQTDKQQHGLLCVSPTVSKTRTSPRPSPRTSSTSATSSFLGSITSRLSTIRSKPDDEESTLGCRISGPSTYVPDMTPEWSVNDYLNVHSVNDIENPLIDHPELGPAIFEELRKDSVYRDLPESVVIRRKMERMRRKERREEEEVADAGIDAGAGVEETHQDDTIMAVGVAK